MKKTLIFIILGFLILPFAEISSAKDFVEDSSSNSDSSDSSFDPFSDYSEFEEGTEEEADINFFRNGRFFTLGAAVGGQMFTDTYGKLYAPSTTYGIFVSYFFSLRLSIQASYLVADHIYTLDDGRTNTHLYGNMNLQRLNLDFKYYFNTQNVTRGLAWINPYIIGGFSNNYRTITLTGQPGYVRDTCYGAQAGLGVEFPLMRGKMFLGGQVTYNYISFADRGTASVDNVGNTVGPIMNGDAITGLGLIGVNF